MSEAILLQRQQALLKALTASASEAVRLIPQGLQAVRDGDAALGKAGLARGLQAYRLNAQVLADKVLAQAFPRLRQELGEADFAAMAWACWRQRPPHCGDLGEWGAVVPRFLADQSGMEPWLPELAELEWAIHSLERWPDDALDPASLGLMATAAPPDYTLVLRAGSQLLELSGTAWGAWQGEQSPRDDMDAVQLLLWRPRWRAELQRLGPNEAAFMRALLQGQSLEQALDAAQRSASSGDAFDFGAWLQAALKQGWLGSARLLARR
ncbi:DNA-binding domain-containing protein [Paucibacter sp. DJ2R-2]|uniref:DNA-binding domain-containing protein n=1 Tax=Paucibacter sp. DJ2R-2 TaxID=2893558 RepID=UPI0021E39A6C|nr:DNA-binding domain-containing protein [Paucibacter sp. DJ2R-2]MCV2422948.1 DNA-binding domain-containing protein [Paucibacter sp. DJ4R-1]MCV2440844.1 DNA-binding domain-containing protein [Paucibacter sp. DJ2R-2]